MPHDNSEFGGRQFDSDCVRKIFGTNKVLVSSGATKPAPSKVIRLSLNRICVYGPSKHEKFSREELVKINLVDDHSPIVLNGLIVGEEDSKEVEDYDFLDVETDFNPYLAEITSPFLDGS